MKLFIHITLLICLLPATSYAAEKVAPKKHHNALGIEALSDDLRTLLSEEMEAIQSGMMDIIPAYSAGRWSEIGSIAVKIKNSYILKQSLTKSQEKELHSALPPAFITKDQRFHYLAGMLNHAAKSEKPELINFYFSEMNRSCVKCHSVFATHRFPALAPKEMPENHHTH